MSSCCGCPCTNVATSSTRRSRIASGVRSACSARRVLSRDLAEALALGVHRLADPVGEEKQQIPDGDWKRQLLEAALEALAAIEVQAEHHAVGRQHLDAQFTTARFA